MTQTSGRSASSVAHTVSSSVSARISTASAPPSRAARRETCAADSSPVTRSARRPLRAIAPSAVSRSVDFPTPGSPPTRTSDAGNEPAAENAVELGDAGRDALGLVGRRRRRSERASTGRAAAELRRRAVKLLDERPEGAAARALPEPAARCRATLGARELNGDLRHGTASLGTRSDTVRHESARVRLQVGRRVDKSAGRPQATSTKGRVAWRD